MSDGSEATLFLCADCMDIDTAPYAGKIAGQIKRAWTSEMEANKRSPAEITAVLGKISGLEGKVK